MFGMLRPSVIFRLKLSLGKPCKIFTKLGNPTRFVQVVLNYKIIFSTDTPSPVLQHFVFCFTLWLHLSGTGFPCCLLNLCVHGSCPGLHFLASLGKKGVLATTPVTAVFLGPQLWPRHRGCKEAGDTVPTAGSSHLGVLFSQRSDSSSSWILAFEMTQICTHKIT